MRMNEIKIESHIVPDLARGVAYAEGCFETFRVVKGEVFQCDLHQQRLQKAMAAYGWHIDKKALSIWFLEVIEMAVKQGEDVLVRLTVAGGDADWGLLAGDMVEPLFYVQLMPMKARQHLRLTAVQWAFPLRKKEVKFTSDYAESLRAMQLWKGILPHGNQPLLYSKDDTLLSTLTSNIALYREGQWHTPYGLGVLHGIVRHYLVQQKVLVESICPNNWLDDCEAMVCMNSGVLLQRVSSINGRELHAEDSVYQILENTLLGQTGVKIDILLD